MGDFNTDLLKFESSNPVCNFLDLLSSNYFLPQILLLTRICKNLKTLIDNIFCNIPQISDKAISANLTSSFSDQLPQVFISPEFYNNGKNTQSNTFIHDWKNFNNDGFS